MFRMPGVSYSGPLPKLTALEKQLEINLKNHVQYLAGELGERNIWNYENLSQATNYIQKTFQNYGYITNCQEYKTLGKKVKNIEAELPGILQPPAIIIVGAHYDTVNGSPGADDNASGVAGMLEIARVLKQEKLDNTIRFVAFANEEPPFFYTHKMGSYHYAKSCQQHHDNVIAMFSLEMLGYYNEQSRSQSCPFPLNFFYPNCGNFIGFASNWRNRFLVHQAIKLFREQAQFPSEGIAVPSFVPGISWSDHRSFWKMDYPAIMITDTAFYRNPFYHTAEDIPEKLDYARMARVIAGLINMVKRM